MTRDFISLMNLLHQNPGETFDSLMDAGKVQLAPSASDPDAPDDAAADS